MVNNKISFIIPTFNEQENIEKLFYSIIRNANSLFDFEIIVIDNGSTDHTIEILKKLEIEYYIKPTLNIASLRNYGAAKSSGDILVFLDSDIYLLKDWGINFLKIIDFLNVRSLTVTGSIVGISETKPAWIEKYWITPILDRSKVNYINSGHLITTRFLYNRIGGFNEKLTTGEDYEFCYRAKKIGAEIINETKLKVIHEGYPKTIKEFFNKERWHARGDYIDIKSVLNSKPALVVIFLFILFILSIVLSIIFNNFFLIGFIVIFVSISFISSLYRFNKISIYVLFGTYLYMVYFLARATSLFEVFINKYLMKLNIFLSHKTTDVK